MDNSPKWLPKSKKINKGKSKSKVSWLKLESLWTVINCIGLTKYTNCLMRLRRKLSKIEILSILWRRNYRNITVNLIISILIMRRMKLVRGKFRFYRRNLKLKSNRINKFISRTVFFFNKWRNWEWN